MMKKSYRFNVFLKVSFALCLLLRAAFVSADDWPVPTFPEDSKVEIVSKGMVFNGVEMRIWEVISRMSPEDLLNFYKKQWQGAGSAIGKKVPDFIEYKVGDWDVLSSVENEYQVSVQVQSWGKGRALALVAISDMFDESSFKKFGENFPKKKGTLVLNDIVADDSGKESRTLVLQNRYSVKHNVSFYKRQFSNKGWQQVEAPELKRDRGVLVMVSGSDSLNMTFDRVDGQTNIIAVVTNE